ncbi:MAG: hypothetical protein U0990_09795 [Candidatus Nanopelagicales bacterium]|nr:hypothetical protein [Candidatus Nanopelagicales bacterium]
MARVVNSINIDRKMAGGRYADILDAAGLVADESSGSGVNAIAAMCRCGGLYKGARRKLRRMNGKAAKAEADHGGS